MNEQTANEQTEESGAIVIKPIAHIYTDFPTKFGLPRQSGFSEELAGKIVFEPLYRRQEAVKGLSGYSYIWLLWHFSLSPTGKWNPTVRPPRLGGKIRMGVFATRSPNRPNPIALSSVKLEKIEITPDLGPVLYVSGIDMVDGTPIFDIKPYVPLSDSHPSAMGGFSEENNDNGLTVEISDILMKEIPLEKREALIKALSLDPRPAYQTDPERVYGFEFSGLEIRFTVREKTLSVTEVFKK